MVYKKLDEKELQDINGGSVFPILPNWDQFLNSICGFIDGLNGAKKRGSC
ncbi:bacteriocin [Streptococcus sp. DD11]|nr:bacteriocin [Streptococcus sp. DD11]